MRDKIGMRSHRETLTLGKAIDGLLSGNLALVGDVLLQRLKAVEGSLAD